MNSLVPSSFHWTSATTVALPLVVDRQLCTNVRCNTQTACPTVLPYHSLDLFPALTNCPNAYANSFPCPLAQVSSASIFCASTLMKACTSPSKYVDKHTFLGKGSTSFYGGGKVHNILASHSSFSLCVVHTLNYYAL